MNPSRLDTTTLCEHNNCMIPVNLESPGTFGIVVPTKKETYIVNSLDNDIPEATWKSAVDNDAVYIFCMIHTTILHEILDRDEIIPHRQLDRLVTDSHLGTSKGLKLQ